MCGVFRWGGFSGRRSGRGKTRDAKLALGAQNKGSGKNPRFRGADDNDTGI